VGSSVNCGDPAKNKQADLHPQLNLYKGCSVAMFLVTNCINQWLHQFIKNELVVCGS